MASDSATHKGEPSTGRPAHLDRSRIEDLLNTLCLVFGAVGAAAFVWLWALTLPDFNPPWIRILGAVWLPVGIGGAVITGILGRRGPGRLKSVIGLSLAALTVIAFITLIATADY